MDGFATGLIVGLIIFIIMTLILGWSYHKTDDCWHRWKNWTPPDASGVQMRECEKCGEFISKQSIRTP